MRQQPSRGLAQGERTPHQERCEYDLKSDGQTPRDTRVGEGKTEVDPVGDDGTDGDGRSLDADKETSVVRSRTFRNPGGNGCRVLGTILKSATYRKLLEDHVAHHSISDTAYDTGDDELAETPMRAESGHTDNGSDDHDETTKHHHPPSSESFTDKESNQGTEKCTTGEGNQQLCQETHLTATHTSYTAVTVP